MVLRKLGVARQLNNP